jgi:UDP-GlcNAc:undecaprenyl-phosphate GlcNAc-1-phosphate transferase
MNITIIIASFIIIFILELCYFKVADFFNIIDQPNHRSSHTTLVLRGGGIVFALSLLLYPLYYGFEYSYFLLGLLVISTISFADDIKPVTSKLRIIFHLASVALLFTQLGLFNLPLYWIILSLIFVIGSVNAINFMDGINGITGAYALITLATLLYINYYSMQFISSSLIVTSIISVIVFLFFNFRFKAKCFAGDVGSVSIAFIILFLVLSLIIKTENIIYILILLIYGLDTITTIVFRLIRKENIFDAHRSHFYQYWANERKFSHLLVATTYAIFQLLFNFFIVFFLYKSILAAILLLLVGFLLFVGIRFYTEGSAKLLGR